jgi:hypothetical protein
MSAFQPHASLVGDPDHVKALPATAVLSPLGGIRRASVRSQLPRLARWGSFLSTATIRALKPPNGAPISRPPCPRPKLRDLILDGYEISIHCRAYPCMNRARSSIIHRSGLRNGLCAGLLWPFAQALLASEQAAVVNHPHALRLGPRRCPPARRGLFMPQQASRSPVFEHLLCR